jgi:hypothetical protein
MRTESYVSTRLLLALIVVAGATGGTFGATEADSVADFSGVQGQDGWQYGYVVPSDGPQFIQLPVNGNYSVERGNSWFIDALDAPQRYYTHLNAFGGHPNGLVTSGGKPIEHWAVAVGQARYQGWSKFPAPSATRQLSQHLMASPGRSCWMALKSGARTPLANRRTFPTQPHLLGKRWLRPGFRTKAKGR